MSNEKMRVAVIPEIREVEIVEVPKPVAAAGEVLVDIKACGLCTWEQRTYSGQDKETRRPFAGGHEYSGVIAEIADGTKTDLQVGDRVAVGSKPAGQHDMDRYRMEYAGLWGTMGLADFKAVPVGSVYKVADDLPFEEAAFSEPLGCVVNAANKIDAKLGRDVVVVGAGAMGMLNMLVAKRRGGRVIVSEVDENRVDYAVELGADYGINAKEENAPERVKEITDGKGADVVIVAIGNHQANLDAMEMVGEFGTIMLFASAHPTTELSVDPNFIHRKQVTMTGARHATVEGFLTSTAMLSRKLINVRPLIHKMVPMSNVKEAFELAVQPDTYRVIVTMD